MVVEGAVACNSIYELARDRGVEVPITQVVYEILYEDRNPEEGISLLMNRPLGKE
jgi:glycerol-3-phosphate dehydrogenase (NAD(P)+)